MGVVRWALRSPAIEKCSCAGFVRGCLSMRGPAFGRQFAILAGSRLTPYPAGSSQRRGRSPRQWRSLLRQTEGRTVAVSSREASLQQAWMSSQLTRRRLGALCGISRRRFEGRGSARATSCSDVGRRCRGRYAARVGALRVPALLQGRRAVRGPGCRACRYCIPEASSRPRHEAPATSG